MLNRCDTLILCCDGAAHRDEGFTRRIRDEMKMKIILGTANFFKGYGINKSKGLELRQINNL